MYPAKRRVTLLPRVALAASSVPSSPAAAMQSARLPWEAGWAGAAAQDAGWRPARTWFPLWTVSMSHSCLHLPSVA